MEWEGRRDGWYQGRDGNNSTDDYLHEMCGGGAKGCKMKQESEQKMKRGAKIENKW